MDRVETEKVLIEALKADEPRALFAIVDFILENRERVLDSDAKPNWCKDCKYHIYESWQRSGANNKCKHPILAPETKNYATGITSQDKVNCEEQNKEGMCVHFISKVKKRKPRKKRVAPTDIAEETKKIPYQDTPYGPR